MARLAYGAWPAAEGGQPLRPYPGRSGQTTVKSRASRGATVRHIRCVSGNPCSSSTGGPEPPHRAKTLVRLVWIVTVSKASKVIAAEAIRSASTPGWPGVFDTGVSTGDYPRGYTVTTSTDGVNWSTAVASAAGTGQFTTVPLTGAPVRYVRITLTAASGSWFSVADVRAYTSGQGH
jgi:hypothetical protein